MDDLQGLLAAMEGKMMFRMQQLEDRLQERAADPRTPRLPCPRASIVDRLDQMIYDRRTWADLCERELFAVGQAVVLGYFGAVACFQGGSDAARTALAESLRDSETLDHEDPLTLARWAVEESDVATFR